MMDILEIMVAVFGSGALIVFFMIGIFRWMSIRLFSCLSMPRSSEFYSERDDTESRVTKPRNRFDIGRFDY